MAEKEVANTETEDGVETVDTEASGQRRIPGTEIKVVKALVEFGKRHEDTKAEHKVLTERLTNENAEGIMLFNKHKKHFSETDNGWEYEAGGVVVSITKPGELKLKTKLVASDES